MFRFTVFREEIIVIMEELGGSCLTIIEEDARPGGWRAGWLGSAAEGAPAAFRVAS
jgi:hypothetical protein